MLDPFNKTVSRDRQWWLFYWIGLSASSKMSRRIQGFSHLTHREPGMRSYPLELTIESRKARAQQTFQVTSVSGARFVSRDVEGMRRRLDEMIAREGHYTGATQTNPSIFRIGRYLLTQDEEFEVQGPLTGGEAEVVAIRQGGEIFVSVGSDQCDRELDAIFPDKPKQMCPHPIAATAWPYGEVKDHWDRLQIYSHVVVQGHTVPLQDATLATMVDLEYLLGLDSVQLLPNPMVLYCGSSAFLDEAIVQAIQQHGLPPETAHGTGDQFLARLHDPVLDRTIEHRFRAVPVGDELAERDLIPADRPPGR